MIAPSSKTKDCDAEDHFVGPEKSNAVTTTSVRKAARSVQADTGGTPTPEIEDSRCVSDICKSCRNAQQVIYTDITTY